MYEFTDNNGNFKLEDADLNTGLYFPIANETGLKGAITPELSGDLKTDQNHFVLAPQSIDNLVNDKASRNFWCQIDREGERNFWSATGKSASQQAQKFSDKKDKVTVYGSKMVHQVVRESENLGIKAEVTSFVPVFVNCEIDIFTITNTKDTAMDLVATAAIPLFARSADNLRDHRHVTSLLHRISCVEDGIEIFPTLTFDERGHKINDTRYYVYGLTEQGGKPVEIFPVQEDFIGEGGSMEWPKAVIAGADSSFRKSIATKAGDSVNGQEALGGLGFECVTLNAGESATYVIFTGIGDRPENMDYASVLKLLEETKNHWDKKVNVSYHTGNKNFDQYMNWVSFQPELRRIYGCSFLPHHDYGRGGRGWRDLWQDCLALLLMNPDNVHDMLLGNFAGVRIDGTNATIIGEQIGEFKADRNSITRVWMDHGMWPFMTTKLYIDQTGDVEILLEKVKYFKDRQVCRGRQVDGEYDHEMGTWQRVAKEDNAEYEGTVLEHLLVENLTAFYDVGEHGNMLLRDADWNDAIDMANHRGESVAFTAAYAKNLYDLAEVLKELKKKGTTELYVLKELSLLIEDKNAKTPEEKQELLNQYCQACKHAIAGETVAFSIDALVDNLVEKAEAITSHIRDNEWITDANNFSRYNSYYDDNGRPVENDNMMITGQVFTVMSGVATDEQVADIVKSADNYLFDKDCGGYRLNTDFGQVKTDMGRMFGFAFGEKENGAVFSHMAVMYANALYQRGFAKEGYKSIKALVDQSMNFEKSHIYPGIPEYFGRGGRGLYHYLTGAASWMMLTVVNEMFGVKGRMGQLVVEPKLLAEQFDADDKAAINLFFEGKPYEVVISNPLRLEPDEYKVVKREDVAYKNSAGQDVVAVNVELGK